MLKKLLALLLALCMIFGIMTMTTACSNEDDGDYYDEDDDDDDEDSDKDKDDDDEDDEGNEGDEGEKPGIGKPGVSFGDGDGDLEAEDVAQGVSGIYGTLLDAVTGGDMGLASVGYEMALALSVGQEYIDLLETQMANQGVNMDLSWLNKIGVDMGVYTFEDLMKMAMSASIGSTKIASANVILDMGNSMMYVAVPELFDKSIKMDMVSAGLTLPNPSQMAEQLKQYEDLFAALPSEEALERMITRYVNAFMGELDAPTEDTVTLSYNGVSQNVTACTYDVYMSDVMDMLIAVMKEMQNDKDLEKTLDGVAEWYNAEGRKMAAEYGEAWTDIDIHAELMEGIDESLEDFEDQKAMMTDGLFLSLVIYTDSNKNVAGFYLALSGRDVEMSAYSIASGTNTALYINFSNIFEFAGTGTTNGGKINGSYELSVNGTKYLNIYLEDFDQAALDAGKIKGTVGLSFSEELLYAMEMGAVLTENDCVEFALDLGGASNSVKIKFFKDDKFVVGLDMTYKTVSAQKIQVPGNAVDVNDQNAMNQLSQNMSLDTILNNLKKAGVPQELLDALTGVEEEDYPASERVEYDTFYGDMSDFG